MWNSVYHKYFTPGCNISYGITSALKAALAQAVFPTYRSSEKYKTELGIKVLILLSILPGFWSEIYHWSLIKGIITDSLCISFGPSIRMAALNIAIFKILANFWNVLIHSFYSMGVYLWTYSWS